MINVKAKAAAAAATTEAAAAPADDGEKDKEISELQVWFPMCLGKVFLGWVIGMTLLTDKG